MARSTPRLFVRKARNAYLFIRFQSVHLRGRQSIETWQKWKLSTLIPYLSRNVPLYKELLQTTPAERRALANLPLMSENSFKGRFVEEYTDRSIGFLGAQRALHHPEKNIFLLRRPHLSVPRFRDSLRYRFLLWERPWRMDASWAKIARITAPEPELEYFDISRGNAEEDAAPLEAFAPDVLDVGASLDVVKGLAIRPRIVVATNETKGPVLGAKVFRRLDIDELGPIAIECTAHNGLHVHAESFIVEILGEDGQVLPEGESGRIIVTDLYNYQMPFVRYDTHRRGRMSWKRCACGLHAPRLFLS